MTTMKQKNEGKMKGISTIIMIKVQKQNGDKNDQRLWLWANMSQYLIYLAK